MRASTMVIEWLKFKVEPEFREQFVQKDDEIWTTALSSYPGYLGKELWISPDNLDEVICIVRWDSFESWNAIPEAELQQVDAEMRKAMGATYEIVGSNRYQVRKFPQSD